MHEDVISERIIGACIRVHRVLGPGLLESAYEVCVARELHKLRIPVQRQLHLPIRYDGVQLDVGYRVDMVVANKVIVEFKAIEAMLPVHEAQSLTYLELSGLKLGLIINFNVPRLVDGIVRMVHGLSERSAPSASLR